jgi:2-oxo-4-hydroxy-4-carboxy-5-ureidoimidazoline decarboxylase
MDALKRLNEGPAGEAREELRRCCGASQWAEAMTVRRPFRDREALLAAADEVWWGLEEPDWREAFAHHPKIGDADALRARFASTRQWAVGEQAGVRGAAEETLVALADGNRAYEDRFGFIFIVCATGKTAAEMLALLRERLPKAPAAELEIAAAEQRKITAIRLKKLLSEGP